MVSDMNSTIFLAELADLGRNCEFFICVQNEIRYKPTFSIVPRPISKVLKRL